MTIVTPDQSAHWYTREGKACHVVPYADKARSGEMRPTTLADAKKLDLVPSVTTILQVINKPGLETWKQSQAILASLTLPRNPLESEDLFAKRVVEDMKAQASVAAWKGTQIHEAVEHYLRTQRILLLGDLEPMFIPVRKWVDENVTKVALAEKVLVHPTLGYAGTVDLICEIKNLGSCVVDFKTQGIKNDKPKVYPEWGLQLEAYRMAYWEYAERTVSVVISSESPCEPFVHAWGVETAPDRWEAFNAALTLWKHLKNYE